MAGVPLAGYLRLLFSASASIPGEDLLERCRCYVQVVTTTIMLRTEFVERNERRHVWTISPLRDRKQSLQPAMPVDMVPQGTMPGSNAARRPNRCPQSPLK